MLMKQGAVCGSSAVRSPWVVFGVINNLMFATLIKSAVRVVHALDSCHALFC